MSETNVRTSRGWWVAGILMLGSVLAPVAPAATEVVSAETPWRAYLVLGPGVARTPERLELRRSRGAWWFELGERSESVRVTTVRRGEPTATETVNLRERNPWFSPLPPADWAGAEFDDYAWARFRMDELADFIGGYGVTVPGDEWPAKFHLRTRFGIVDPRQVGDLTLTLTGLGGAVVYVNGQEVGRAHLPEGPLHPLTPAETYPREAYVAEDGSSPLPYLNAGAEPEETWKDRYQRRLRTMTVPIPADVLRSGGNVLAIELFPAAIAGPFHGHRGRGWSHLGIREAALTSSSGRGVIPYAEATVGTRVWSARPEEVVADRVSEQPLLRRNWFWTLYTARGMPVKGFAMGNPFDPVHPIRFAAPRNGTGGGQVVLADLDGLRQVSAALTAPLRGPGGAAILGDAVRVRFAVQGEELHFADGLVAQPPADARAVPVWVRVEVPRGQAPGWYTSVLEVRGNGQTFPVPVQVLVTGAELPDPVAFDSRASFPQCPKTVARHYGVDLWSEDHWRLLEPSIRLLGQLGNDVVEAPVILSNFPAAGRAGRQPGRTSNPEEWRAPLIRFVRDGGRLVPDFTILDRYLDLAVKHGGPPRAISLGIWDPASARELADSYENTRRDSRDTEALAPPTVEVWNRTTGEVAVEEVPNLLADDAEAFWKPLLDGVRALVVRRGWDERVIVLGLGSDVRPGRRTGERVRAWAPYARWDILSHFSGDPRPEDGRLIATGGLEVGIRRMPALNASRPMSAADLGRAQEDPPEFLDLPTARWQHQPYSPPLLFRTLPMLGGRLGQMGLDYWAPRNQGTSITSFFSHVSWLAVPGPQGAEPTVRLEMIREGLQDHELRATLVRRAATLAEGEREALLALADELGHILGHGQYLSLHETALGWLDYSPRLQEAVADLAGVRTDARWDRPPAP